MVPSVASEARPPRWRAWIAALRPTTLPASAAPVLVGTSLAHYDGVMDPIPAGAALGGALLIQIGTNLANDYQDYHRGADASDRAGPPRATAMGWIPPRRVLGAAVVAFLLAAVVGSYLVLHAGWPILIIGILALISGYAYTGGPYPFGYHGWGDLVVLVFFGPVAVAGTYYVQDANVPWTTLAAGVAMGSLATAILVVNNLRDVDTDRRAAKFTLAVRLGPRFARFEYAALLLIAYAVLGLLAWRLHPAFLLPLVTLPLGVLLVLRAWRTGPARALNPVLAATAQLMALYAILFALGGLMA